MDDDYRFLNPYNFVRYLPEGKKDETSEIKLLGRCPPPPHDRFVGLSGRITCKLEAVTPIFIADSEFVKGDEHKSYRFFKLKNEKGEEDYAIPSTSLRGILRSIFEAATNSCFSIFEGGLLGKRGPGRYDKRLPLTAGRIVEIPRNKDKTGLVTEMKYYKLPHTKFPQYKNKFELNGKYVWVLIDDDEITKVMDPEPQSEIPNDYVVGYLKTSDKGLPGVNSKKNEYVFIEDTATFELSYEKYKDYIISNRNNKQEHTKVPKSGDTIWFRHEGGKIKEFGYAQIYRKPFKNSINDFLPEFLYTCVDYYNLCPACRLFGWVHPEPQNDLNFKTTYSSRIRISPAQISGNKDIFGDFQLAILSTPKPTTAFFYLLNKNGRPDFSVTYNTDGAQLRGRKFYRHQTEALKKEYERTGMPSNQNRTLREVLKPKANFVFTIEFENLSPVELGALLWSIEMENGMFHKLGMGKPLGFGSVKISIENINLLNVEERYKSFTSNGYNLINRDTWKAWINLFKKSMKDKHNKNFEELDNIKDLKAILSASSLPVHYPRTKQDDPQGKNFEWFMNNQRYGNVPLKLAPEDTGMPLNFSNKKGK